jgi:hypothetical protein
MRRVIIIVALVLAAVVAAVGGIIANDLSNLRREVGDIQYRLGDLENALRGSPSTATLDTVRRRIDIIRDDLRRLTLEHQLATALFRNETQDVWNRFGRLEQQARAAGPRR